jgi:hypothetical protein
MTGIGIGTGGNALPIIGPDATTAGTAVATQIANLSAPAKNMIFDSSWFTDGDQYTGLRLILWAHKVKAVNILAFTCCATDNTVTNQTPPRIVSQFMASAGVSGIPISSGPTTTLVNLSGTSSIGSFFSQSWIPAGRLGNSSGLMTSVPLMRTVLAAATDKVDISSDGMLNNLYDLLNSPPDSISPLSGRQLVSQKVGTLYTMGGQYPLTTAAVGAEFNFGNVPTFTSTLWGCTDFVLKNWPTPIVFVGFEIGVTFSCAAYYALTAADPLGYLLNNNATYKFGRHGWTATHALISIGGPTKAGFTTVQGRNSINVNTGFNTFNAANGGPHYYVVPGVSQRAIQQTVDSISAPGANQPTVFNAVAETVFTTPHAVGATDASNLIVWYQADDLGLSNGNAVVNWTDRCARANLIQLTATLQPVFATAKNAKVGVTFSGAQGLNTDTTLSLPHDMTVYCLVCFDSITASFALVMSHGASLGSTNLRSFDMQRGRTGDPSGCCRCDTVIQNTFTTPLSAGGSVNTWYVFALRRQAGKVQAYLNGAGGTELAISVPATFDALTAVASNHIVGLLTVGGQYIDATPAVQNGLIGGIREIRIYNNAHSATQISAVTAEMV